MQYNMFAVTRENITCKETGLHIRQAYLYTFAVIPCITEVAGYPEVTRPAEQHFG